MSNTVCTWLTKYYLIHGDKPALLHHQLCQIIPVHIPLSRSCHQPVLMPLITFLW